MLKSDLLILLLMFYQCLHMSALSLSTDCCTFVAEQSLNILIHMNYVCAATRAMKMVCILRSLQYKLDRFMYFCTFPSYAQAGRQVKNRET